MNTDSVKAAQSNLEDAYARACDTADAAREAEEAYLLALNVYVAVSTALQDLGDV